MITEVDRAEGPSKTPPFWRLPESPGKLCFECHTQEPAEAKRGRDQTLKTHGVTPVFTWSCPGCWRSARCYSASSLSCWCRLSWAWPRPPPAGEAKSTHGHQPPRGQWAWPSHQKSSEQKPPAWQANPRLKFYLKPSLPAFAQSGRSSMAFPNAESTTWWFSHAEVAIMLDVKLLDFEHKNEAKPALWD